MGTCALGVLYTPPAVPGGQEQRSTNNEFHNGLIATQTVTTSCAASTENVHRDVNACKNIRAAWTRTTFVTSSTLPDYPQRR